MDKNKNKNKNIQEESPISDLPSDNSGGTEEEVEISEEKKIFLKK